MPSSNGVYSLPPGYLAATGTTIQVSQHNPIFEDVAAALTARLSRDGSAPMTGPINLAAGSVTAPSLIFQGNILNGVYPTTNGIGVGIGGVQVAEFLAGGISGAFLPGMMIPWTLTAVPSSLWALPFGQTLNRITYAALWTLAQIEIAAGSTLYNNGDGSTTFGIPDMRGRLPAGWDVMGGTAAGRLTSAAVLAGSTTTATAGGTTTLTAASAGSQTFTGTSNQTITLPVVSTLSLGNAFFFQNNSTGGLTINSSGGNLVAILGPGTTATVSCIAVTGTGSTSWAPGGGVNGAVLGSFGGAQTFVLTPRQIPAGIPSSGSNSITVFLNGNSGLSVPGVSGGNGTAQITPSGGTTNIPTSVTNSWTGSTTMQGNNPIAVTSTNGAQTAMPTVPPVLICNFLLFVGGS